LDGKRDGLIDATKLGPREGIALGADAGFSEPFRVGAVLEPITGLMLGRNDETTLGVDAGFDEGCRVGLPAGLRLRLNDGTALGCSTGAPWGSTLGVALEL